MEKNSKKSKQSIYRDDYKKSSKKRIDIGEEEFEEMRSTKIRMKPQAFRQSTK